MSHKRIAVAVATVLSLAACSGNGGNSGGEGKTITVWVMDGDYTDTTLQAINKRFTEATGASVDLQIQQWEGITTKISTALSTTGTPDILDLGNTQVPGFAASGGLLDLTPYRNDLKQGRTWLAGLEDPATVDGALYAAPGFAGARAVIYNKKTWTAAGITATPKTYAELTAALDKIEAGNPAADFAPFYLPGQYWFAGLQFLWDAGGEIATHEGGAWKGGFSTPAGQKGLTEFTTFQNTYSTPASRTLDTITPDQTQLFADGKTSAILATSGSIGLIQKANPAIKNEDIGTFPFPGTSGKTQPVMLGGSDWGIAAKSDAHDLALQWVKIAASPAVQDEFVFGNDGWIPNSTEGIQAAQAKGLTEQQQGFFGGALSSKATPAAAQWPTIEGDKSINQVFSAVASGAETPEAAAKEFDAHLESTLATGQ
ncbi:N,N'-diacetylchitobiose transport system substrate-binding protein [Actinoplanes campanulatus]|uniref:N,N'-diacetylchitobiose transport system substrate-binding protein n=1 Tax=Actinoplanes campanulatus TaxID=113559 RepID=A0A7W5AS60_9ACTN|nr:extracellular solute-binding protein [Actinoplanes campanulatus]MBB3101398.1 N,N'-diacetylchitobiose transport system substrate-binding protein [Actinoplanes campanulatus]GGN49568.1 ABC transporter substrate-binding protein [Actinoplanes campanulatus]GID42244.1 ABC transporter substrate-binding protein [Actinoplanes campanulatus]